MVLGAGELQTTADRILKQAIRSIFKQNCILRRYERSWVTIQGSSVWAIVTMFKTLLGFLSLVT
jgi:hypothetical protein